MNIDSLDKATAANADVQPERTATNDQIASVMLQRGTPEQQRQALEYCGMTVTPAAEKAEWPDAATVDKHLEAVLRCSGSSLRHYSMAKPLAEMRGAMRVAMAARPAAVGAGDLTDAQLWNAYEAMLKTVEYFGKEAALKVGRAALRPAANGAGGQS